MGAEDGGLQPADAAPVYVELVSFPTSPASSESQDAWGEIEDVVGDETAIEKSSDASAIDQGLNQSPPKQKSVLWRGYAHSMLRTINIQAIVPEDRVIAFRTKDTSSNYREGRSVSVCLRVSESW
jgi:hypothetical protein